MQRSDKNRLLRIGVPGASICFLILGLAIAAPTADAEAAQATGYRVIVHPDNPAGSISTQRVSRMFLGQTSRWEHGPEVEPVDQGPGSAARELFSRAVHGRSVSSIKNYWQRQASSSGAKPPAEVASNAAVVAYVKSHPGGIGYVSPQARLDVVKIIRVVR